MKGVCFPCSSLLWLEEIRASAWRKSVCSSGIFSLGIGGLGKCVNFPRGPSPTQWMQSRQAVPGGTSHLLAGPVSHSIMTLSTKGLSPS